MFTVRLATAVGNFSVRQSGEPIQKNDIAFFFGTGFQRFTPFFAVMFINLSGNFPLAVKSTLPLRKRIILRSIVSPHERKLMSVTKPSISTQELEMHFNVIPLPQNEITVLQVLIFMLSLS